MIHVKKNLLVIICQVDDGLLEATWNIKNQR